MVSSFDLASSLTVPSADERTEPVDHLRLRVMVGMSALNFLTDAAYGKALGRGEWPGPARVGLDWPRPGKGGGCGEPHEAQGSPRDTRILRRTRDGQSF